MGTVFKKTYTKPLPADATLVDRNGKPQAQWRDSKGKLRRADVTTGKDGRDRLFLTARTYTAKYRDGQGLLKEVATGCRDEAAARAVLSDLERRAEKVKGGLLTREEADAIDHQDLPLDRQFETYLVKLQAEGTTSVHRANVRRCLFRIAKDCKFMQLSQLSRDALERWLVAQQKAGMSARTRNIYRAALVAFCNWCLETGRMLTNPFTKVAKADEVADPRRQRRSLTEEELGRLIQAARTRPLAEAATVRRGRRKGQPAASLKAKTRQRLEKLGWERALIYKTLVLTGLRRGELASLTIGQLRLDEPTPYLVLKAADEKNRQGATIPVRADLAEDLRNWLVTKSHEALDSPLFTVPKGLIRILDRDLVAAGIARRVQVGPNKWVIDKRDDRGRTVDVHALRHTFGTLLTKGGVMPRTAQAAMRHSDVNLTMNTYTDPKLLDVSAAIAALPELPLGACAVGNQLSGSLGAVCDKASAAESRLAPELAPTPFQAGPIGSIVDTAVNAPSHCSVEKGVDEGAFADKEIRPLSISDNGRQEERAKGFEPSTSSLGS